MEKTGEGQSVQFINHSFIVHRICSPYQCKSKNDSGCLVALSISIYNSNRPNPSSGRPRWCDPRYHSSIIIQFLSNTDGTAVCTDLQAAQQKLRRLHTFSSKSHSLEDDKCEVLIHICHASDGIAVNHKMRRSQRRNARFTRERRACRHTRHIKPSLISFMDFSTLTQAWPWLCGALRCSGCGGHDACHKGSTQSTPRMRGVCDDNTDGGNGQRFTAQWPKPFK